MLYRPVTHLEMDGLVKPVVPKIDGVSERDMLFAAFEVGLQIRDHLELCARLRPTVNLDQRCQGVLIGHMVRLYKILDTFLLLVSTSRYEVAGAFLRPLTETIIDLTFLLKNHSKNVLESYIKASLAYDKQSLRDLEEFKNEPSIMSSASKLATEVEANFERAEISFNDVTGEFKWGSPGCTTTRDRARATDNFALYSFGFKYWSRLLHGSWFEIEHFHLSKNLSEYMPKTTYRHCDSALLLGSIGYASLAGLDYSKFMLGTVRHRLCKSLLGLSNWCTGQIEMTEKSSNTQATVQ